MQIENQVLILGIGNILMGDEGVGVHCIRHLEGKSLPPNAVLIDGGTGGFNLLGYFTEYPRIIMIDATMDGKPDGTVTVLHPKFSSDFPKSLGAHDIGLKDLVESATILGKMPETILLTVSISAMEAMDMTLSAPVAAALDVLYAKIVELFPNEANYLY
jgi:hydrogenase maturation protease